MMSTNLVSTIMQALSQEAIGRIASSLGLEQSAAQRGISAGIPGILAGLANTASTPEGAQRLGNSVSAVEDMPGTDIVRSLLSGNMQNIAESGLGVLSSLMGSSSLGTLSSVIGQFAGFGQGSAKRLLGLLVPVVLGFLKREQTAQGLDSRGLATLLADQHENIERAMPAGVSRNLQFAEARAFSQPSPSTSDRFRRPTPAAEESSSRNWAYWLVPALVAAGIAAYLLPPREDTHTVQAPSPAPVKDTAQLQPSQQPAARQNFQPSPVPAAGPVLGPAAIAIENDIVSTISRLRTSLQTIKDTGSAQGSLNELKDIAAQFGRLKTQAQQLSPDVRKALAAAVAGRVPDLNGLIDRLGSEGMASGGEAKPAMDNVKSELLSISRV